VQIRQQSAAGAFTFTIAGGSLVITPTAALPLPDITNCVMVGDFGHAVQDPFDWTSLEGRWMVLLRGAGIPWSVLLPRFCGF